MCSGGLLVGSQCRVAEDLLHDKMSCNSEKGKKKKAVTNGTNFPSTRITFGNWISHLRIWFCKCSN